MAFSIGTAFTIGGAIARLLDGDPPSVQVDSIKLENAESPDMLGFGGDQQMTVHRLLGGQRAVDLMGHDDRDISIKGFLEGSGAMDKAGALDTMRRDGGMRTLTWADERRQVVVKHFECDYQHSGFWLPYVLTMLVIPPKKGTGTQTTSRSLLGDLLKSSGLGDLSGNIRQAQGYLAQAQQALPIVAAINPRLAATVEGYAASASGALTGGLAASEGRLSGVAAAASGLGFTGQSGANARQAQTQAARDMAATLAAQAWAGRAQANARTIAAGG